MPGRFLCCNLSRQAHSHEILAERHFSFNLDPDEAEKMLRLSKAAITKAADERVEAELIFNGTSYPLVIQKNEERNFDTSCTCAETSHPLCEHKTLLFLQLLNAYGANYFDSIRNWDKEKNKLLQIYGYSLNDDLTGKFEFTYKEDSQDWFGEDFTLQGKLRNNGYKIYIDTDLSTEIKHIGTSIF